MKIIKFGSLIKPSSSLSPNQIVWEVVDPKKYMHQSAFTPQLETPYVGDWMRDYSICFESQYADTGQTDKEVAKGIISDLNRLLGLNASWEKRKEKVLVLVPIPPKGLKPQSNERTHKLSVAEFIYQINQRPDNPYVFNGMKINEDTQLELNLSSWTDIAAIRKALSPYGLNLREEERMVDKFILTEIKGGLIIDTKMSAVAKAKRDAQQGMPVPSASEGITFLESNKKEPGIITLPSGLQYKVIRMGKGPKPSVNNKVLIHYLGSFVNGKIFESSYEKGVPYAFNLKDLVKGFTEALQLMPVGSEWKIYLPAGLAYGATGSMSVSPDVALIFDLQLLKILE